MEEKKGYILMGFIALIVSLIVNAQMTIAILLALILIIVVFASMGDKNDVDTDELMEMMNTKIDEIKEFCALLFCGVMSFIMFATYTYECFTHI